MSPDLHDNAYVRLQLIRTLEGAEIPGDLYRLPKSEVNSGLMHVCGGGLQSSASIRISEGRRNPRVVLARKQHIRRA